MMGAPRFVIPFPENGRRGRREKKEREKAGKRRKREKGRRKKKEKENEKIPREYRCRRARGDRETKLRLANDKYYNACHPLAAHRRREVPPIVYQTPREIFIQRGFLAHTIASSGSSPCRRRRRRRRKNTPRALPTTLPVLKVHFRACRPREFPRSGYTRETARLHPPRKTLFMRVPRG